jgi:hypothetical protein
MLHDINSKSLKGKTFGEQLLMFAKSVDIFTSDLHRDFHMAVVSYLKINFNIMVTGHLVPSLVKIREQIVSGKFREQLVPGLRRAEWTAGGRDWDAPIFVDNDRYYGQVSYAFDKNKELWIVSGVEDDDLLRNGGECIDLNNQTIDHSLPDFVPSDESLPIRTSIIFPVYTKYDKEKM